MILRMKGFASSVVGIISALPLVASAQAAGPYTPEQVYFVLRTAIQEALGIPATDPTQDVWLSLSTVGSVVSANDNAHINDLANFCPVAKPVLDAFDREPKLDAVYERVIDSTISPTRTFTSDYYKAKGFLFNADGKPSAAFVKYRDAQKAYVAAWTKYMYAKDLVERSTAAIDMKNAEDDWGGGGYRQEVDTALNVTAQEEYAAGTTRQSRRRNVLAAYRASGMSLTDVNGAAYVSPASSFSPTPDKWETSPGWVKISFASDQSMSRYNSSDSSRSGFGGLSLGFVNIGGTTGGHQTTTSRVKTVYKLSYEFELMRISINRPWLDTTLLFLPQDWTWKKAQNTPTYPRVAVQKDGTTGRPIPSKNSTYDNKEVGCALLPVEAVVARNRKIVATVSKTDYQEIQKAGSAAAGGSLFGIFGGAGKQNWNTTQINDDGQNITFSVEAPGIAVIGFVSQFVPLSPNPNPNDTWPANAWLPTNAAIAGAQQ